MVNCFTTFGANLSVEGELLYTVISVTFVIDICLLKDVKKQTQMAMLSKERDRLVTAVRSYKSLFDTTNQLIAELRSMSVYFLFQFLIHRQHDFSVILTNIYLNLFENTVGVQFFGTTVYVCIDVKTAYCQCRELCTASTLS